MAKLKKIISLVIGAQILFLYFVFLPIKTVQADPFYPVGDMADCHFSSTIGVQYNSIGGNGVSWNSSDVSGVNGNWIQSHRFTDIANPYAPNAQRYIGIADKVSVPPNTQVEVGFWAWNYSGHWVNVPDVHLFNSRSDRSLGDVTRLGASGNYNTICWTINSTQLCRSGMVVNSGSIGGYADRGNEMGRVIYSFETIQPIQLVSFDNYPVWARSNLRIRYDLVLENVSEYDLCNIRVVDELPSGEIYDENHCINAGETVTITYYANMPADYEYSTDNDPATIYDNNSHIETTSLPMAAADDNTPETRPSVPFRDDAGVPGWSGAQASWGQISYGLYTVELIPYSFTTAPITSEVDPIIDHEKMLRHNDGEWTNESTFTVDPEDPSRNEFDYRIRIWNDGARTIDGILVIDDYDEDLIEILDPAGGIDNGDTIVWDNLTLRHGEEIVLIIHTRIKESVPEGTYRLINFVETLVNNPTPNTVIPPVAMAGSLVSVPFSGSVLGVSTLPPTGSKLITAPTSLFVLIAGVLLLRRFGKTTTKEK